MKETAQLVVVTDLRHGDGEPLKTSVEVVSYEDGFTSADIARAIVRGIRAGDVQLTTTTSTEHQEQV